MLENLWNKEENGRKAGKTGRACLCWKCLDGVHNNLVACGCILDTAPKALKGIVCRIIT